MRYADNSQSKTAFEKWFCRRRETQIARCAARTEKARRRILFASRRYIRTYTADSTGLIRVGMMQTTTDFVLEEAEEQLRYVHNCNEQMASKLKAILEQR